MIEYRTNRFTHATEIFLPEEFSFIEELLTSKDAPDFSYNVPVVRSDRCASCGALVVLCRLSSGRWFDAEVTVDSQGTRRAELTHEHHCAESDRHQEFLEVPTERGDGREQP